MLEVFKPKDSSIFTKRQLQEENDIFTVEEISELTFKTMFKRECIIAQSLSLSNSTTFNDIKVLACSNWKIQTQDFILALQPKQN